MKTASLTFAALLLFAGLAAAQTETQPPQGQSQDPTTQQTDMRVKKGTAQTYNTGATGQNVGKDNPAPVSGQDQGAASTAGANRADGTRGTGVATGFVAAGIGLAILGLFVRRKGRNDFGPGDPDDPGRGSGTQTRM